MLSKLRHAEAAKGTTSCGHDLDLAAQLQQAMGGELTRLQPAALGTLGVGYTGLMRGQERFFKTHGVPAARPTLLREARLLKATAGDRVDAHTLLLGEGAHERAWLHMRRLQPGAELTPDQVWVLVADGERVLDQVPELAALVPDGDDAPLLLSRARHALTSLSAEGLLCTPVVDRVSGLLLELESGASSWARRLCHGDLGPANILSDALGPVVVDWEDVFWGFSGYDYLYWLTFFRNRRWLSPAVLGRTPYGVAHEVAWMVAILVLKSWLSVRDGSHLHNTIDFDQRLWEVIQLG